MTPTPPKFRHAEETILQRLTVMDPVGSSHATMGRGVTGSATMVSRETPELEKEPPPTD